MRGEEWDGQKQNLELNSIVCDRAHMRTYTHTEGENRSKPN